jgi:hypothetical protein
MSTTTTDKLWGLWGSLKLAVLAAIDSGAPAPAPAPAPASVPRPQLVLTPEFLHQQDRDAELAERLAMEYRDPWQERELAEL